MKKIWAVLLVVPVLYSCSSTQANKYVEMQDYYRLKREVNKNRFALKQALNEVISLKKAIKEINHQLEKQNRINERLFDEISILREMKELQENKSGVVITAYANFREKPSRKSKVLLVLPKKTRIEILGKKGRWYKARVGGLIGYIHENVVVTM